MKKHLVILMSLFSSVTLFSQVGINTENPQQLFHTDGKSSVATTNPTTGAPSVAQQVDDVVITNQGRIGIGTTAPSEKLEVNGKTKINDLPVNGSDGFTATRTLVANNNGVIGVLNGLPPGAYDGYNLTGMQGLISSNLTNRVYSYTNIVHTKISEWLYSPNPSLTFSPIYTISFDRKSSNTNKYILLNFDYSFKTNTKGGTMIRSSYSNYELLIYLNNKLIKTFSSSAEYAKEGNATLVQNKNLMIDLSNETVLSTNNKLELVIKLGTNIFKYNEGSGPGQFDPSDSSFITLSAKDVIFQFFEK